MERETAAAGSSVPPRRSFRLLTPGQVCSRLRCRQETIVVQKENVDMEGIDGFEVLGMASEGILPVAIGGGSAAALTVIGRLAAPAGSTFHRHVPAMAGAAGAVFTGLVTKSYAGALVALLVGGVVWGSERLLEYQAQKLLRP